MSEARFYCPDLAGDVMRLQGEEARHAAVVRRLKPGAEIIAFDGRGTLVRAVIETVARRGDELTARVSERRQEPAPIRAVHLACALPKGDRQSVLLDMATQLGITHFTPLLCEHGVAQPGEAAMARAQRIVLEACKQSRRVHLPVLNAPGTPGEVARGAKERGERVVVAHPDGARFVLPSDASVMLVVGPEAGFTTMEIEAMLAAGAVKTGLGANILRIETAAVAMLSATVLCRG